MAKEKIPDLSLGDQLPLGSRIRLRRISGGERLADMARGLRYDKSHLSKVENNIVPPSQTLLQRIAEHLQISVPELQAASLDRLTEGLDPLGVINEALERPRYNIRQRPGLQRIGRIVAMGHLAETEEAWLYERLIRITAELVGFVKDTRQR